MALALGILRGFGVIYLCLVALNFGRADKWWAWALAGVPIGVIIWAMALEHGGAIPGLFAALAFMAVTAAFCWARRTFEWVARI